MTSLASTKDDVSANPTASLFSTRPRLRSPCGSATTTRAPARLAPATPVRAVLYYQFSVTPVGIGGAACVCSSAIRKLHTALPHSRPMWQSIVLGVRGAVRFGARKATAPFVAVSRFFAFSNSPIVSPNQLLVPFSPPEPPEFYVGVAAESPSLPPSLPPPCLEVSYASNGRKATTPLWPPKPWGRGGKARQRQREAAEKRKHPHQHQHQHQHHYHQQAPTSAQQQRGLGDSEGLGFETGGKTTNQSTAAPTPPPPPPGTMVVMISWVSESNPFFNSPGNMPATDGRTHKISCRSPRMCRGAAVDVYV